jgi:hypothetical protein
MPDSEGDLLDVCLNDGRGYVQGSQMLAEAARLIGGVEVTLDGAAFRALTDRTIRLVDGMAGGVGQARFLTPAGPRNVSFAAEAERAPEGALPGRVETSPIAVSHAAATASVSFGGAAGLRDLLDVAVQLTKGLHRAMTPEAEDVWFTSLRQAGLPTRPASPLDGEMRAAVTRTLSAGDRIQSLNALTIRTPAFEAEAMIGFVHHRKGATWG